MSPAKLSFLVATLSAGAALAQAPGAPTPAPVKAPAPATGSVALKSPSGADAGSATLAEGPTGVLIRLQLRGLAPGWHGVHFHAVGDCSDPKFEHAGAHINAATKKAHGLLNPGGPDFGDLPNVSVGADGTAMAELFTDRVSLTGAGGRAALTDADGSALLVHANADDQSTQPIGGAGARVACGVVR